MNFQPQQKKKPVVTSDSILESLRDISSGVGKTVASDVGGKVSADILASLLGKTPQSGEMRPDRPIEMDDRKSRFSHESEGIHQLAKRDEAEIRQKIEAIRAELATLSKSIAGMNIEIQKAVSEQPVEPGVYHLNFLDQLKSVLLTLRQNIEDGRTWLAAFTSRKQKRMYWGMYKKHGTTFGLSSERTLATQAG